MTLSFSAEDEAFRERLRAFLQEHPPGKPPKDKPGKLAHQKTWAATKFDHGWAGPGWPAQAGGMDLPFSQHVIYLEEMARARVPAHPGSGSYIVGPTLIKHGTDEQRDRYLRGMLRGDDLWAQAFSEPEAGSDLQSLRTRAVRDGDHYLVTGQKVWNTSASIADMLFALVRTGTQESRQAGISYLLIDARSPGITIRPLRDMAGNEHFAEIFFDSVAVPVTNRIGEENGGWAITRTSLGHERSAEALNQAAFYGAALDQLVALAKERGRTADPLVRDALADLVIRVRIMRINAMRTISAIIATGEAGPSSSISRLYNSTLEQQLHVVATDLLGPYGLIGHGDEHAVQSGRWSQGMLMTRASTIGAGTAEIQRNTIAEQVLGLPYDPAMPAR